MRIRESIVSFALAAIAFLGFTFGAYGQQGVISTVVGNGPNDIPAVNANLYYPQQLAVDAQGNVYVAAYQQSRVFKIAPGGAITLIAGNGVAGYSGDGGQATAANLYYPQGVAVDSANPANVYIADTYNCVVRKVTASTGVITTIAGLVTVPAIGAPYTTCGNAGDGGEADAAQIYYPIGLAINPTNTDLYILDNENANVRKVAGGAATGTITTIAGAPATNCTGTAPFGDTGAATSATFCNPVGIALDTTVSPANVFISDSQHCVVREVVGSTGKIYQIAGSYTLGCGLTDGVKATNGQLNYPQQLAVQVSGKTTTVTVADEYNYLIRQFTLTYSGGVPTPGNITTIAGDGSSYSGDGGPALSAGITEPVGVAYDSGGDLFLAGQAEERVREVTKSTGDINTIAGWGGIYYSDPVGISGVPGGGVSLYIPSDVFIAPSSTKVYIGGYGSQNAYVWDSSTTDISNVAGNGFAGYAGDGGLATAAATELDYPQGIVRDSSGNVYIADQSNCVVRRVAASGNIHTYVGGTDGAPNGCGYSGDGGPASKAQIYEIQGMAIDSANNLYLADYYNCLIRKVTPGGTISTVAGLVTTVNGVKTAGNCAYSGDGGSALSAELYYPIGVAVDGAGNVYIDEYQTSRIRKVDPNDGIIETVAGNGRAGYSGDGPATQNSIYYPQRIAADTNGNLFISDYDNYILRWVDPGGQMTTFAGTPQNAGFGGDGGVATSALLYNPLGIAQDSSGNFYVADSYNARIRKITAFAGYGRSTADLSFGNQATGTSSEYQSLYLSAIGPVTINSITMPTGFSEIDDCAGTNLTAGQTCEIDVAFTPTKTGETEGLLSISSNALLAGQASTVDLSGLGIGLTLSGSLAFGNEPLNTPVSSTVTLTNSGAAVTLSKIYLTKVTQYSITGGTCPTGGGTLASGASCTITVTFTPTSVGSHTVTLVIASTDPSSPLLAGATGTGTEVELSTASLAFGNTYFANPTTMNVTVTNVGTASFTVSSAVSGSGASSFSVTGCTSAVAGGGNCTLTVKFNPAGVATYGATLTLTTTGGSNPTVALSGTGVAAGSVTPSSIAFGSVATGGTSTIDVTVKNLGPTTALTISTAFSGTGAGAYHIAGTGDTCTGPIAAGASCTLPVKFEPTKVQSYPATLTVTTSGGTNPTVTITGAGS